LASLPNGGPEFRVAVVGSGPAGFYTAGPLLSDAARSISVDVFDRLPTPWGLVRSGVAPDHPKLKMVSAVFEKTASRPGFRFFGNVRVGSDVTRADLLRHYHAVVYATGAENDRKLGIPGEHLPGSHSALQFVGWYNGHPDFSEERFDLSCERAVVVGNGNVALDLARMLSLSREDLACTDVADHALERLAESAVRETIVVGRRGPAQASFTSPELNEFALLESIRVEVHEPSVLEFAPDPASSGSEELRRLELLRQFAGAGGVRAAGDCRTVQFRFLSSPVAIRGEDKVEEIVLERNELYLDDSATFRARPTGELVTVPTGLVLRAVGYGGTELTGVPFDASKGVIAQRQGRVVSPSGSPSAGEYCVGWIKRGPTGVIGTNKRDALETVTALLADLDAGVGNVPVEPCPDAILELLIARGVQVVDQECWQRIDSHERARGDAASRPRVKAGRWDELLSLAGRPGGGPPR